jgi:hypothetical protein
VRPESGSAQAGKYFGNLILRILRRFSRRKAFVHRVFLCSQRIIVQPAHHFGAISVEQIL